MTRFEYRCDQCKDHLFGDIEIDTGLCGRCADRMYEREQEAREWAYYHPPLADRAAPQMGETKGVRK